MIITRTEYVIITKNRPTQFLTRTGELTEDFEQALRLNSTDEVLEELNNMDEPHEFEFVDVIITVEV